MSRTEPLVPTAGGQRRTPSRGPRASSADAVLRAEEPAAYRDAEERPFYTPSDLAKKLRLSERTIREMLRTNKIASYKIEGSRRVRPADLEAYLAKRRAEAAA